MHAHRIGWLPGVFLAVFGSAGFAGAQERRTATPRVAEEPVGAEEGDVSERLAALEARWAELKLDDPWTIRPYYNNGLNFASNNKEVAIKLGGRIQLDAAWFPEDDDFQNDTGEIPGLGDQQDGVEFRRARLYVSGRLFEHFEYKAQYDFAETNRTGFRDVYGGLVGLPVVGGVRAGHFKEPFGLEELTSSNYITFMERALVTAFTPARNIGVMAHNAILDRRMTWAVGGFRATPDDLPELSNDGGYSATARVTALPILGECPEGPCLLHLGASATYQGFPDDMVRIRERPEVHLADRFVDTGSSPMLMSDYGYGAGLEAAFVTGPVSVQGEAMGFAANGVDMQGDFFGFGYYAFVSWFLTGESRPYDAGKGVFGRVKPLENFLDGGCGAWELALRYSHLNLEEGDILGGELHDATAGVNWYWNPIFRVMLNYVYAHRESVGNAHIAQMRFQVAF